MDNRTHGIEERIRAKVERRAKLAEKIREEEYAQEAKDRMAEQVSEVPQETKQQILNLLREGRKIGEVCDTVELDLMLVCEIISQNIVDGVMLRKEAI